MHRFLHSMPMPTGLRIECFDTHICPLFLGHYGESLPSSLFSKGCGVNVPAESLTGESLVQAFKEMMVPLLLPEFHTSQSGGKKQTFRSAG